MTRTKINHTIAMQSKGTEQQGAVGAAADLEHGRRAGKGRERARTHVLKQDRELLRDSRRAQAGCTCSLLHSLLVGCTLSK